jgi:hypothetical protein
MPGTESPSSNLLSALNLALMTERQTGDLQKLDPATITGALERLAELAAEMRTTRDLSGMNEHDAIADHIGTLISFRRQKIAASIGRGRPANMLPAEAAYLDGLTALTATLEDAWGLRA